MSANSRTAAITPARRSEVVVNFDPVRVAAPFALRCGALTIDYMLVVIAPVSMMLISRYFGNDGTRLIGGSLNDTGWLIAIVIAVANMVLLPAFGGRSVGKAVTGLTIVGLDGEPASTGRVILRQTVGYAITAVTLGLGFFFSFLNKPGRAIHDYLSGTVVIFGKRNYR